jgi:FkbM family methyltransferase
MTLARPTPVARRLHGSEVRRALRAAPANIVRWALNVGGQRRAIGRGYVFDVLGFVTPAIAVDTDGLRLYLSTADRVVSRGTFVNGAYERTLLNRAVAEIEGRADGGALAGRVFLDVGANIGTASCLALRAHGAKHAWAFEPAPDNVRLLRLNLLANGLERSTTVHACALSDSDGAVVLEVCAKNSGDNRVRTHSVPSAPSLLGEAHWPTVEVPARRLDGFVAAGALDPDAIGLAWIDAQGHEAHVLDGARTLLGAGVPIVCEFWPYGLRRAGALDHFCDLVAATRARFIEIGKPGRTVRPTTDLRPLAGTIAGMDHADLLLLPAR